MKQYHYRPTFNSKEYGPAEKRADEYWKKRRGDIMPVKPRITCRYPSCQRIAVQNGYCEKHQETKPQYSYQKDKARHAMYNRHWQRESKKFLADHPWCDDCMTKGINKVATEVHHKVKHEGNYKLFWDRSNWSGLCHKCHSKRTARGE